MNSTQDSGHPDGTKHHSELRGREHELAGAGLDLEKVVPGGERACYSLETTMS